MLFISIKNTSLYYRDNDGEYHGINAIANDSTAQQIAQIEAKGAETRASIPADYTVLSNQVDEHYKLVERGQTDGGKVCDLRGNHP